MKTIILFILTFSVFSSSISLAQTKTDSIATKPFLGGYIFKMDGRNMTIGKLSKVLKTDPEATKE